MNTGGGRRGEGNQGYEGSITFIKLDGDPGTRGRELTSQAVTKLAVLLTPTS